MEDYIIKNVLPLTSIILLLILILQTMLFERKLPQKRRYIKKTKLQVSDNPEVTKHGIMRNLFNPKKPTKKEVRDSENEREKMKPDWDEGV